MEQLNNSELERWWKRPEVQQVLAAMLENFTTAVQQLVPDGLRDGHAVALRRAARHKQTKTWKGWRSKGAAYHVWMYHFFGGSCAKLHPPPAAQGT